METLFIALIVLFVLGAVVTVVGHGLWLALAWMFRDLIGSETSTPSPIKPDLVDCPNCGFQVLQHAMFCGRCGLPRPSQLAVDLLSDLATTERQIQRFYDSGKLDTDAFNLLKSKIEEERARVESRATAQPPTISQPVEQTTKGDEPSSDTSTVEEQPAWSIDQPGRFVSDLHSEEESEVIEPVPSFLTPPQQTIYEAPRVEPESGAPAPARPRKSFSEMLNSFMEESNIRWGEIVGGLLIIGCSTALVVSLWSQISQIPVLKFLIFTTVTAALFGVGLYTEHRWKLPTTSRGILTIATLLVPLNFLAIAAVSGGAESPGALVIGSELIAPIVFLCLVYLAGKVLTPSWPHLLGAGVLGSSIGQLLVRHFSSPEISPALLILLGAFPVVCYVACTIWMLRKVLDDREIDETEATAIFISLGAMTFATVLPFGLLLYKSGPIGMTMMYLAALVSFAGFPLLATGALLQERITNVDLVASRTAGTSMAILGVLIVLSGMILAWPNPASIVPAALFNFAVFTAIAIYLNIPRSHFLASVCFGLAYLVTFHVIADHVAWQNLRVTSLLRESLSLSSGQALAGLFVLYLPASEWLGSKRTRSEAKAYLVAAGVIALISLALVRGYGEWYSSSIHQLWPIFAIYTLGAFWIAARTRQVVFSWLGSFLLLLSFAQPFAASLGVPFPWQTALLAHASVSAAGAVIAWHYEGDLRGLLTRPLYQSALLTSLLSVVCLVQAREWQTTAMEAERVFWLAGIWLALLWVVRERALFTVFQIALTCALALTIKGVLQQYEWYAYLPHAFLHPWGLQIQGTMMVLLSLSWVALRLAFKSGVIKHDKLKFAGHLVDSRWSFDRLMVWGLLIGLLLLAIYGALPGVTRELTAEGIDNPSWNIAGFPHQEAFGAGSWIVLGLLVVTLVTNAWERRRAVYIIAALTALSLVSPLLAGRFESQIATASAWRWLAVVFLIIASLPLLYREKTFAWLKSIGWPEVDTSEARLARWVRTLLLAVTLGPLIILTSYPALRAIYYMPVHGPAAGIFHIFDERVLYGVPLVIVALVLIGYAIRERLPGYAFAGGLLFNVTVTMTYLLSVVAVNGSMNRVVFAKAIQWNAIAFGLYAIVWLQTFRRWVERLSEIHALEARRLLTLQISLAIGANAIVIGPVAAKLIARPEFAGLGTLQAGSLLGWLALMVATVAAVTFARAYQKIITPTALFAFLIGASCLIAFGLAAPDSDHWAASHGLLVACAVTAWLMVFSRKIPARLLEMPTHARTLISSWVRFDDNWARECLFFAAVGGGLTAVLSLRRWTDDPSSNWWTIGPLVAMTILFASLNWLTLKRRYLYLAGTAFSVGALVWAVTYFKKPVIRFLDIHVIALAIPAVIWLVLERRARRLSGKARSNAFSFHNVAALWSVSIIVLLVSVRLMLRLDGFAELWRVSAMDWLAWGALAALMIACVWDRSAKYAVALLYVVGLLAAAMFLDYLSLLPDRLAWAGMIAMAVYVLGASILWRSRRRILEFANRLRIPKRMDPSATELAWLNVFNAFLAAVVVLLAYWVVLDFAGFTYRVTAAVAVAGLAVTFALLAEGLSRSQWQRTTIAMFVAGMVLLGWAFLVPDLTGTWLNRAVILMVEMFVFVGLYALALNEAIERAPDWTKSARACIPWLAGTGVVALIFALSTEVFYQINFGTVRIHPVSLVAVGLVLLGGIVLSIVFALSSKHDPLGLTEIGRRKYVYAGEIMLALLFMHIRLTMPWLFSGFFERYWPFVVMAIAYLGVVISEALRRREILVLAHPIERNGVFLPLLPVLGFWVVQSEVDYSALLFVVGGIYGLLSILRRSFVFGMLAAVAGNGALWYMLNRTDNYQFLQHPQLWLIPVALSVLLAAYLNEDDFTEDQMTGIRYMSLVTIYASSTADIFINGVADSPWLPLVLAGLSLAGVFGGILFRIRGLLMLGCVFLLIAIITMIWYASVNLGWTWLWYVAGIATGATIIFMFALFEKKRAEVLRMVDGFKDWER